MEGQEDWYDKQKVADVVLALLHLNAFSEHEVERAWKGFDWGALDRLHEQGMISDPKSKARSVVLTREGSERARQLFEEMFGI